MRFRSYRKQYKDQCLKIFDSNLDKYFDVSERDMYSEYLDSLDDDATYYICVLSGEVVACGGYDASSEVGSLKWGMVHRTFHGKGVGSKLTDFRLSLLSNNEVVKLVKIDTSQHTAGFYIKRGFVQTNVVEGGFGEGIDCVTMELVLTC